MILYNKTEIDIRGLQALSVEAQQYGNLLIPVLVSKVPQELRLIISREFDTGNWSLDEVLKVFKTEVEARERCNSMAMTPSTTRERKHPCKPPPLLTSEGERITCTFCRQDHKSVDCVVVTKGHTQETRALLHLSYALPHCKELLFQTELLKLFSMTSPKFMHG